LHEETHAPVVSQRYGVQSFVVPSAAREVCGSEHVAPDTHFPLVQRPPGAQSPSAVHVALH
jgi:hypothetical protein